MSLPFKIQSHNFWNNLDQLKWMDVSGEVKKHIQIREGFLQEKKASQIKVNKEFNREKCS